MEENEVLESEELENEVDESEDGFVDEDELLEDEEETEDSEEDDADGESDDASETDDDEEKDPFEGLFDDEEEESEPEEGGDDADTSTEGDNSEPPSSQNEEEGKDAKYDALSNEVKETLKKLGYKGEGDPIELLKRLQAEADGVSSAEYDKKVAFEKKTAEDLAAIHAAYPETAKYKSWKDFPHYVEFAHLMDDKKAKLTAVQAFSAAHPEIVAAHVANANRAKNLAGTKKHLTSSVPKGAKDTSSKMTRSELDYYRELLPDATDEEIKKIYKRIT